jgi:hypothetical protein
MLFYEGCKTKCISVACTRMSMLWSSGMQQHMQHLPAQILQGKAYSMHMLTVHMQKNQGQTLAHAHNTRMHTCHGVSSTFRMRLRNSYNHRDSLPTLHTYQRSTDDHTPAVHAHRCCNVRSCRLRALPKRAPRMLLAIRPAAATAANPGASCSAGASEPA